MFEESSECFICREPTRAGDLYCSALCRAQDTGKQGALKNVPIHLTSHLPAAISPLFRPQVSLQHTPRMPPSSSSSSSGSLSPKSPVTNPSGFEIPARETFDLGPPAYPNSHLHFSGSVPVKIPTLAPRPTPAPPPAPSHGAVYGTSIDTLRFGRKPSLINSVTSPNALLARCACGKPANHAMRATSRERGAETEFSRLSLGSSAVHREKRTPSDSNGHSRMIDRRSISGHGTPAFEPIQFGSGSGSSALSRSRSDPLHPKLHSRTHANGYPEEAVSPSRRASVTESARPAASREAGDRGRSRERIKHALEAAGDALRNPTDREPAPSRSRHRRDEREREKASRREQGPPRQSPSLAPIDPAPIVPTGYRGIGADDGIAPSPLRAGWRSPRKA